jgi:hypothetical protein
MLHNGSVSACQAEGASSILVIGTGNDVKEKSYFCRTTVLVQKIRCKWLRYIAAFTFFYSVLISLIRDRLKARLEFLVLCI